jgi:undecaprenyl-diphosphatase
MLVCVGLGLFAIGILVGLLIVGRHGGGPIQAWDDSVERWFPAHRGPLVGVSRLVATYLNVVPLGAICLTLTATLAFTLRTIRAIVPLVAYAGAELEVVLLHAIVVRPRPSTAHYPAAGALRGMRANGYSFPSGHCLDVSAVLFALLGTLALTHGTWWPWLLAVLGSAFVAETRLVLGVHWFSDVVFGVLLGAAWGVTVAVVAHDLEWADVLAGARHSRSREVGEGPSG